MRDETLRLVGVAVGGSVPLRLMFVLLMMLTFAGVAHAHPPLDPCLFDPVACKNKNRWNRMPGLPVIPGGLGEIPKELPTPPPARPAPSDAPPGEPDGERRLKPPVQDVTPAQDVTPENKRRPAKKRRRVKPVSKDAAKASTAGAPQAASPAAPDAAVEAVGVQPVPAPASDLASSAEPPPGEPTPLPAESTSPPRSQALPPTATTARPPAETTVTPAAVLERSKFETATLYLRLGFTHILPLGLDHILFVLGLFLASTRVRPLLLQITAFTLAHTITLALASTGLAQAPADIIEPLIALSIVFVAVENIYFKEMSRWRPFVVFAFGLFHGLGFAGVLQELGLPRDHFVTALISFNVGVEFGQLSVVLIAAVPCILLYRRLAKEGVERLYRPIAVVPASVVIAAVGLYWTIERTFGAG